MNVQTVVGQVRARMRDHGYSESALARLTGIPQPTINRALKRPVRLSRTHRALCKFLGIDVSAVASNPDTREELVQELLEIWDGSREHAQSLARLLRAAATLQAHGAIQASRNR